METPSAIDSAKLQEQLHKWLDETTSKSACAIGIKNFLGQKNLVNPRVYIAEGSAVYSPVDTVEPSRATAMLVTKREYAMKGTTGCLCYDISGSDLMVAVMWCIPMFTERVSENKFNVRCLRSGECNENLFKYLNDNARVAMESVYASVLREHVLDMRVDHDAPMRGLLSRPSTEEAAVLLRIENNTGVEVSARGVNAVCGSAVCGPECPVIAPGEVVHALWEGTPFVSVFLFLDYGDAETVLAVHFDVGTSLVQGQQTAYKHHWWRVCPVTWGDAHVLHRVTSASADMSSRAYERCVVATCAAKPNAPPPPAIEVTAVAYGHPRAVVSVVLSSVPGAAVAAVPQEQAEAPADSAAPQNAVVAEAQTASAQEAAVGRQEPAVSTPLASPAAPAEDGAASEAARSECAVTEQPAENATSPVTREVEEPKEEPASEEIAEVKEEDKESVADVAVKKEKKKRGTKEVKKTERKRKEKKDRGTKDKKDRDRDKDKDKDKDKGKRSKGKTHHKLRGDKDKGKHKERHRRRKHKHETSDSSSSSSEEESQSEISENESESESSQSDSSHHVSESSDSGSSDGESSRKTRKDRKNKRKRSPSATAKTKKQRKSRSGTGKKGTQS
eukprot:m51a1_g13886 hypothetical protein (617) ;mRNA; r:660802-664208